jgi:hypothetical protein
MLSDMPAAILFNAVARVHSGVTDDDDERLHTHHETTPSLRKRRK